jgi:hypothetical protein
MIIIIRSMDSDSINWKINHDFDFRMEEYLFILVVVCFFIPSHQSSKNTLLQSYSWTCMYYRWPRRGVDIYYNKRNYAGLFPTYGHKQRRIFWMLDSLTWMLVLLSTYVNIITTMFVSLKSIHPDGYIFYNELEWILLSQWYDAIILSQENTSILKCNLYVDPVIVSTQADVWLHMWCNIINVQEEM